MKDDDIDKSRKILEDSNRIDKSKTGIEAREIFKDEIAAIISQADYHGLTKKDVQFLKNAKFKK